MLSVLTTTGGGLACKEKEHTGETSETCHFKPEEPENTMPPSGFHLLVSCFGTAS